MIARLEAVGYFCFCQNCAHWHTVGNSFSPATIKNQKNISVINKDLVEFLMTTQCLPLEEGSRHIIDISENLSNSKDYITYKIIRKKS